MKRDARYDMIKKLFSLVVMLTCAVVAWADDVATVNSQTLWTFGDYAGQTSKVFNFNGIYLHSAQTGTAYEDFSVDADHLATTSGTFTETSVSWNASKVLTVKNGVGSSFLSQSSVTAESESGAEASLAFNYSGTGKLYVVYGATTMADGSFYIIQKKSDETAYSTIYNKVMEGISYTGVLGSREADFSRRAASDDYKFTQAEAVVSLTGEGTVYIGGSQPYCIYAVLFVPNYDDIPIYGTYDFQTWAGENVSGDDMSLIVLDANGYMTGSFTPVTEGVTITESMTLNDVFSIAETSANTYKLRKNSSAANTGLLINKTGNASITINRLQAGDWFTIATNYSDHLAFAADNANVKKAGSSTTVTKDTFVEPGVTYVVTGATNVSLYNNTTGNTYIYSVTIANTEVVSPPTISADNGQVTITGGASTADKNVTTYYTIDGSTPTAESTPYTTAISISETRIVKAISISETGVVSSVTTQKVSIAGATPSTIWDFVNDDSLIPLAWGDDHFTRSYYTTADKENSDFRYLTNEPIHAKMAWQSDGENKENASTTDGEGLKKLADSRAFTINDLAVGDVIYITYTTTGDQLKTSKNSSKGNTIMIGETTVTEGQTEIVSGAKIEVTKVDESNNYVAFMPNSKITITQIAINPVYKITATSEHGTIAATSPEGVNLSIDTFTPGTEVVLEVTPSSDEWAFSHWVVNGQQESSATLTLTMDCDKTVEAVFSQVVSATGVPVIIVAGQSNTDGRIKTTETAFPYTLNHTQISYCNGDVNGSYPVVDEGNFVTYGTIPRSDAGESWGYDAIIYNNIQTLLGGNTDFYVIKQSKGNTAVNAMSTSGNNQHWWSVNPVWLDRNTSANQGGRSLFKALKDNIDKSLKVLEDDNKEYDIKFLMWHQGEADRGKGAEYETQMKAVIGELRNYLVERTGNNKYSNLPVILGGIADVSGEYKAEVEAGKQALASADAHVYYAPTGTMTLDEDFRSDKVHFNATGAEKLATSVWDIITTNNLMNGITLAGDDTPVVNPLAEDVVSETTTWNFTTTGALTEGQSQNGLYNHRGTVYQKDYGTITLSDGSELDGTFAATTNGADRKSVASQGLTAGYTGLTYVYSVNVDCEGTFMAVLRPLSIKEANTQQYARLMLNGEELHTEAITSTDENVQLVGKTTGKGTFTVFCGESWDFIGAKFIKGATTIEIMTAPTIEAGSGLNTVKINPGTSDQSDATIKTYYTTDGSTPTAQSGEYTGTELTLKQDCTVKAVSISSKGGIAYSEDYAFSYEEPTSPVTYDFLKYYSENPTAELGMSSDNTVKVYYHRSSDDSDRNANFNYVTAEPVNSMLSVLSSGMEYVTGGIKVAKDRPFAIHGLKVGDVIRIEFDGSLYYAKNTTIGNALEGLTINDNVESLEAYTVSSVDATNNYVVFFPSVNTTISQISINAELTPHVTATMPQVAFEKVEEEKSIYTITYKEGQTLHYTLGSAEQVDITAASPYSLEVSESAELIAWTTTDDGTSEQLKVNVYAPTPSIEKDGVYDFLTMTKSLTIEYTPISLESEKTTTVNETDLYAPTALTAATFNGRFAFNTVSGNGWRFRKSNGIMLEKNKEAYLALLGLTAGDEIIITLGGLEAAENQTTDIIGETTITSGTSYTVKADGDLILKLTTTANTYINKVEILNTPEFYISPAGDDANSGTMSSPFKTLKKAQERASSGSIIHILPGTYQVTSEEYMDQISSSSWNVVYNLNKSNIQYLGEVDDQGNRPVFDFSSLTDSKQIIGFYLTAQNIVVQNIEAKGVQSEAFRLNGAANCTLKNIAAHSSQGIGFKLIGNAKGNLIEDCDVYENGDGFISQVNANCEDNQFVHCRAWSNTGDGFNLANSYSVVTVEECVAYKNNYGVKAGGFGEGTVTLPESGAPMHVVRNTIAAENTEVGFYANNHLGGLQLEKNRAYKNGVDYRMTNDANQPGYGHVMMSNLSYGNTDINKVIADIDAAQCTVAGNSFSYANGAWTNATHSDADFVSVDTNLLTKARDAEGNLATDVFNFLKLAVEEETVDAPAVKIVSQSTEKVTYTITYPADAELHYILPGASSETVTTEGETVEGMKELTLEVTVAGDMKLYSQKGNAVSEIVTVKVTLSEEPIAIVDNAIVTLTDDSRKDRKVYQVVFGSLQKLYYMRPEQDTQARSQSYKEEYATTPMTITVSYNGPFVYWTEETINKVKYESKKDTIMVNSIAKRPTATFVQVVGETSEYEVEFTKGTSLYYKIGDNEEQIVAEGEKATIVVEKTGKMIAYSKNDYVVSDTLSTTVFAPTPAPDEEGVIDFAEATEELPADIEVTLDENQSVSIGEETLYKPSALTAATFSGKFAFSELTKKNQIRMRTNHQLVFSTGEDMRMAILNVAKGDVVAFEYTGTILMDNPTALAADDEASGSRRAEETADNLMVSGSSYIAQQDGHLLFTLSLATENVNISKMYIGPEPDMSETMNVDFMKAAEEYIDLEYGYTTNVYYSGKTTAQKFTRVTNSDEVLPIDGRLSMENTSAEMNAYGVKSGNRRIAIHNLGKGDVITVRFFDGSVTYEGHETYGDRVTMDGVRMEASDTLQSGVSIIVDKVDCLHNYVVLKLDSKVSVATITVNGEEADKIGIPTITDQGKNTFKITAGKSLKGKTVYTSYTTDGTTPTDMNGTISPYESFDVELLSGGMVTVKAVSFDGEGNFSDVASLVIYVDERVHGPSFIYDENGARLDVYNMQGLKVTDLQKGKLYIVKGKKVIYQ